MAAVLRRILFGYVVLIQALWADALFLTVPVEAQHQGLGNAGVSTAKGSAAMRYNPAGLGLSGFHELSLNYLRMGAYLSANSLYYTHSFAPFFGMGIFATALYLNRSFVQVQDFIETGNSLNMVNVELGISVGYEILPNLAVGNSLRYFRLQLGPQVSQSFGVDFGAQYRIFIPAFDQKESPLAFGVALRNLGPDFDFYQGGQKEKQPLMLRIGSSYDVFRWLQLISDYGYSRIEGHSYHAGLQFLQNFYLSPRAGLQVDFSGISYTLGSGFQWQKGDDSFIANLALSLGHGPNGGDFLVSLMYRTTNMYISRSPKPAGKTGSLFSLEEDLSLYYTPNKLVTFRSAYKSEKIQGIVISVVEAQGYLQKNHRLRRVAIQPEDEIHLQEMEKFGQRELKLTKRKMGLWLKLENFPEEESYAAWETLSSFLEQNQKITTMLGKDLSYLNANPNAPLQVEWRLDVKIVESNKRKELRTALYELYENKLVLAKNIPIDTEEMEIVLQEIGEFYNQYLENVESYYLLRLYP